MTNLIKSLAHVQAQEGKAGGLYSGFACAPLVHLSAETTQLAPCEFAMSGNPTDGIERCMMRHFIVRARHLPKGHCRAMGLRLAGILVGLLGLGMQRSVAPVAWQAKFSRLQGTSAKGPACTAGGFPRCASRHPVAPFPWEQPYLKFAVSNY